MPQGSADPEKRPQDEPSQFFWSSKSERSKKEGSMVKQKYSDEFKYRLRKYDQYFSIYLTEARDKEYNYSLHPYEYKNLFMKFVKPSFA